MMDRNYENIDENAVRAWIIGRLAVSIILNTAYILLLCLFIIPKFGYMTAVRYSAYILAAVIVLLSILESFIWPFLEYKQWKYGIFANEIELINGIIVRKKIIIPISRIQNLKIEQGPIQRVYGITSVNIITAGGCHEIPSIPLEEAEIITERLKRIIEIGSGNG